MVVVVGNEEDVGLNKLEMMGKLLGSKPAGLSSKVRHTSNMMLFANLSAYSRLCK